MQVVNTTLAPRYGDLMSRAPSERDAHLLARIAAGDDRALAEVYDEHTAVVYGVAWRVTRNEHLARDVCQEVFAYLWEMPSRVDLTKGSIRAYLAMLAHRRAVDEVRRCERRTRAEGGASHPNDEKEGPEVEVVDGAAAAWRDQRLAEVLTQLPGEQVTALRLAYFDGLSYRQVAAALGIPEGTAKSRLHYSARYLARKWRSTEDV